MRKVLLAAASAAACLISSAASAAVVVTVPTPAIYTPPTSGGVIGQVAAGATNTDTFAFTIAGTTSALFSGQLSNAALTPGGPGNINFSNILLDGVAGLFTLVTPAGAAETQACCGAGGNGTVTLAPGNHTLTFTATNTSNVLGTYSGNFNFAVAAVPEPSTWAMMLLGFGATGMMLRRRRRTVLAQVA